MKKVTAAAVATVVTSTAASAVTLDFTTGVVPFTGTEFGGWTLTFSPDQPNVSEAGPGTINLDNGDTLSGVTDGVGIITDELDGASNQFAVLTFTTDVRLTNVYGLDLFVSLAAPEQEEMRVTVGSTPGMIDAAFAANTTSQPGFGDLKTNLIGSTFTFWAGIGNDNAGQPDFALAGVTIAPIPLPASALLLLGAVGGLGAMRRAKKA